MSSRTSTSRCLAALGCLVLLCTVGATYALGAPPADEVDFSRDVLPILSKNCFGCHGPDEESREAELRLDTRVGATADLGDRRAIEPGQSDRSEAYRRITSHDPDKVMPPPDTGLKLTAEQIAVVRRWIESGAPYSLNWSFRSVRRPPLPEVSDPGWIRSPIDAFVLARLEREGFVPSAAADRYEIVRRLYLDLIGIPPTLEEADQFVTDRSPDAYRRLVDRLLASPRFGERWASVWLDLARYADTQGYEKDNARIIWPYRDWVIRAYNAGLTYDKFTIHQIAGDLLPGPTQQMLVATGFHRNTMTNTEGGTDDEEFRSLAVKDRVATTMQVWMGVTMGCAQCHNHKFDPISNREYYEFYAFFNQTEDTDRGDDKPRLNVGGTTTLVMKELPANKHRATHVHLRGNFLSPGDKVAAATPRSLHPLPSAAPRNRLGVAQWLVDGQNPLTSRVAANRIWARMFGTGLVETEEDFGTQGMLPSHPELLDWLAAELMAREWDTKSLMRSIVTSATYRQTSATTAELHGRDPYNRRLSRGPRFRIEAETVRDQALAVSGLLSNKMYGPPVMPPQPDGIWRVVYSGQKWVTSAGQDRYRRALYTYRRRTSPYPSMITFDAGSGEVCLVRRIRTNSPLQALITLNDPVYVKAAAALAQRVLRERPDGDLQPRLDHAFRTCLIRPPTEPETSALIKAYERSLHYWTEHPQEAQRFVAKASPVPVEMDDADIAERAAWITMANVLLNLDEMLTKR